MKVGILGVGIVGGATAKVFGKAHEIFLWDKYKESCNSQENLNKMAKESEVVFVCVPTPMQSNGSMDYSAIYDSIARLESSARQQARLPGDILVTIRSTAVSGTTDKLAEEYPFFRFAFNPEFLTEKNALQDMEDTERVVLGVEDEKSKAQLDKLYKALFPNASYTFVDRKTAEMIKYTANVMLASQIGVANEIYQICKALNLNYDKIKSIVLQDDRIGRNIDVPGPDGDFGFGGKCFPKDMNALIHLSENKGYDPQILKSIWELNLRVRQRKDWHDIPGAISSNNNYSKDSNIL